MRLAPPGGALSAGAACAVPGAGVRLGMLLDAAAGGASRASENWLPELKPLETDQGVLCHEGITEDTHGSTGKPATARNQIKWRVAAEARRQHRHTPAAAARTTTLLSIASRNSGARREF